MSNRQAVANRSFFISTATKYVTVNKGDTVTILDAEEGIYKIEAQGLRCAVGKSWLTPIIFPSAQHAWVRIARAIAVYGGEFDRGFYKVLLAQQHCVPAIAALQADGVQFKRNDCFKWGYEICGSFEITHPRYMPPKGSELPAAQELYDTMVHLFGMTEADFKL
jgi:hypothetical protein